MWLTGSLAISFYLRQAGSWSRPTAFLSTSMPTARQHSKGGNEEVSAAKAAVKDLRTPTKRRRVSTNTDGVAADERPTAVTPSPAAKKNTLLPDEKAVGSNSQQHPADNTILFRLDELVKGTLVARPSRRNKSPFVADVLLDDEQREVLVHVPSLDMCGKCVPGTTILAKPAKTPKGDLVGPDAVSPKYGTPKCEFTSQLILVDDKVETTEKPLAIYTPTWVGAHPSIGERVTEEWLKRGLLLQDLPPITSIQRQFTFVCEDGTSMRPDFMTTHEDGTKVLVEVKTIVDTDYRSIENVPLAVKGKFRKNMVSTNESYVRTAIFPSGNGKQKGPDGETVVSSRAIKHVQELTRIVQQSRQARDVTSDEAVEEHYEALVVFCVVRGDAEAFRANHVACPSFAKYLKEAKEQGVRIVAKRTRWDEKGTCFSDKELPIDWLER